MAATTAIALPRTQVAAQKRPVELRRDVTVWGSYTWGYADVGADIYAALGLVIGAAMGAAPLAFALAGLVYIMIGLAYTELASTYPVAGGGQYFTLRGLGDLWGFVVCCLWCGVFVEFCLTVWFWLGSDSLNCSGPYISGFV